MGMLRKQSRQREDGFTLIELLVVVAIIGLLAAFAVPRLWDAITKAKMAPGQADMKTITGALDRYNMDNHEYPRGTDATAVMGALRGNYLKTSTTFRNGFKRSYLYLTSDGGKGFLLVDVADQAQDDDATTAGQQITVRCTDGSTNQDRTFTVGQGDTAALVIPTVASGNWTVSDSHISNCVLLNTNPLIKLETH